MPEKMVRCVKLHKELPGLDENTYTGDQARRMCLLIGGEEMRRRVFESVSAEAWSQWTDHMRMILNEFRLDPTSDETNDILRPYMESFFFGQEREIPNYVPPEQQ